MLWFDDLRRIGSGRETDWDELFADLEPFDLGLDHKQPLFLEEDLDDLWDDEEKDPEDDD